MVDNELLRVDQSPKDVANTIERFVGACNRLPFLWNLKAEMLDWQIDRQIEVRCRMGLPAPNVDLKIIDSKGKALPHDGRQPR